MLTWVGPQHVQPLISGNSYSNVKLEFESGRALEEYEVMNYFLLENLHSRSSETCWLFRP